MEPKNFEGHYYALTRTQQFESIKRLIDPNREGGVSALELTEALKVLKALEDGYREYFESAEETILHIDQENAKRALEIDTLLERELRLEERLTATTGVVEYLNDELGKLREAYSAQIESGDFWAAKARANGIALSAKEIEVEDLNRRVNDLKAKLYDLIERCGAA